MPSKYCWWRDSRTWPQDYGITEEDAEQAERERGERQVAKSRAAAGFDAFCNDVEAVRGRED